MPDEDRLDPQVMRELEAAHLPTVPAIALSKDFVSSMLGKITSPFTASQNVLKSGEIGAASVKPEEVLQMGSVLTPGLTRGGVGVGAAGGRPPIGGTRGSSFLSPSPIDVTKFWNKVDAYRGNVRLLAQSEGVNEHTIRARLESPTWARPANMPKRTPQLLAQMEGLKAQAPKDPTPEDVRVFWNTIDRFQRLRNWREPVLQLLGISGSQLDARIRNPKWARSVGRQKQASGVPLPAGSTQTAEFGPDDEAKRKRTGRETGEERERRLNDEEQQRQLFDKYDIHKPHEVPDPARGNKMGMSVEDFYGAP